MFKMELGFNPYDKKNEVFDSYNQNGRANFLNSFKLAAGHIFCYNGDPRRKISSMKHTSRIDEVLDANIGNNADSYFYVNGGRKQYAINTISCCFVDIDAGRDSSGNYLPSKEVMKFKQSALDKINSFPVEPSWVVDTRNGYQIYWILDDQSRTLINKTTWNGIQKKLVNYFGGDARAIKINQIYRVPYTWWRKCWEGKAPYFTSVLVGSTGQSINVKDLIYALNGQPATVTVVPNATSDAWFEQWRKTYKNSDSTGLPVSVDAAQKILNELNNQKAVYTNSSSDYCGQKNTTKTDINNVWGSYGGYKKNHTLEDWQNLNTNKHEKAYGDPMPVNYTSTDDLGGPAGAGLVLSGEQAKLLKTVVEYLNQASTALYFSNNRFLSGAARDLANQISDKFCVG
jgi:hypothetical protein